MSCGACKFSHWHVCTGTTALRKKLRVNHGVTILFELRTETSQIKTPLWVRVEPYQTQSVPLRQNATNRHGKAQVSANCSKRTEFSLPSLPVDRRAQHTRRHLYTQKSVISLRKNV